MAEPESPDAEAPNAVATEEGASEATPAESRDYTVSIEDVGPCRKKASVAVKKERVTREFDKAYKELSKTIQIRGFRPGKVPRRVLERKFGKHVREDIEHSLPHELAEEIIEGGDFKALGHIHPEEIQLADDGSLTFSCTFDVKPVFELPDLSTVKVSRPAIEVTDAEVDEKLKALAASQSAYEKVEDGITPTDLLVADVSFEGEDKKWSDEDVWIEASATEIETFEVEGLAAAVAGKKPESSVEVDAKSSDGIPGKMQIVIRQVKRLVPPPIDDAFAKKQNCDDVKELKEKIRSDELFRKEREAEAATRKEILKAVCQSLDFDMPQSLIDRGVERRKLEHRYKLLRENKTGEELDKAVEEATEEIRAEVVLDTRGQFVLDKIANDNKIFVTEEEIDAKLAEVASATGRHIEEVREVYDSKGITGQMREEIRLERAWEFLKGKAQVSEAAE